MNSGIRICTLIAVFLLVFPLPVSAVEEAPENSAISAILIDLSSGRVLYEKNPNEERLIASITKLMTALVAVESHPDLSEMVEIQPEWANVEGSSIYLQAGETLTLETLLYGLMLHSGNDAAVAIAGYCAGDIETFVDWMNQRAGDLGMTHTHFQNPNGLNDEAHYSTAKDMAKVAVAAMKNKAVAQVVATKSISLEGRTFTNHNKLLWQYEGCVGMKTGYTQMAGRTLISSATRDGQTLIVVTLSDPDDWKDHKNLLDYGFETYPLEVFYEEGQQLPGIPVEGSLTRSVPIYVNSEVSYPLGEEEKAEVTVLLPQQVAAPVESGAIAGQITVSLGGSVVAESYLRYGDSVRRDAVAASAGIRWMMELFRTEETGSFTQLLLDESR